MKGTGASSILCLAAALLASTGKTADGHGSILIPVSRNSIDSTLPPWSHGKRALTHSLHAAPAQWQCTLRGRHTVRPRTAHHASQARRARRPQASQAQHAPPRAADPPSGAHVWKGNACNCVNGTEDCNSGQSCFWFSQGAPGCPPPSHMLALVRATAGVSRHLQGTLRSRSCSRCGIWGH